MPQNKKPILVTGSHRAGTTWVGKMIATHPSIGYIHEPFNLDRRQRRPGTCNAPLRFWFEYICPENDSSFYQSIHDTINFKYKVFDEAGAARNIRDAAALVRDCSKSMWHRTRKSRPLVKDPIAIFSTEWLAEKFDMDIVVMIRHPAAFASSLKKASWPHPFSHFLQQPLLMRQHLYPFEEEIREFAREEKDILDQATLLWRLIHHVIKSYQEKHENDQNWTFVRHEDISRNPIHGFESILNKVGLDFSNEVRETIKKHSSSLNPKETRSVDSITIDSQANILSWKSRLTENEISRVKEMTADIYPSFYSESEW